MGKQSSTLILAMLLVLTSLVITVSSEQIQTLSGTTRTVDDSGGADFTSIQDAIDASSNGDTVFVYSGTYVENIVVDKSITLQGEDRDTTVIDGGGSGDVVYVSAFFVNISGFTIQNSGNETIGSGSFIDAGIDINSNNNEVYDNYIYDNFCKENLINN